jgi:hypothetical protein
MHSTRCSGRGPRSNREILVRSGADRGDIRRVANRETPVFLVGVAGFEPTAPRSQSGRIAFRMPDPVPQ